MVVSEEQSIHRWLYRELVINLVSQNPKVITSLANKAK